MTYFTSDLHLGHQNIIRFSLRPFETVEEMDRTLIGNWNSRVTDYDDIYILGDMFYRTAYSVSVTLEKLKGKKHLIIGNHDHTWLKNVNLEKHFIKVRDLLVLKEEGRVMVLCHYPLMSWPHMHHGSYQIYGHIHNNANDASYWPLIENNPMMLNAGVDVNGYYPVPFNELVKDNEIFKEKCKEDRSVTTIV